MHRTVNIGILEDGLRKSTGKEKSLRGNRALFQRHGKAERNARLTVGEDKVFGDDFADVDLREELCYHSRPKKQFGGLI